MLAIEENAEHVKEAFRQQRRQHEVQFGHDRCLGSLQQSFDAFDEVVDFNVGVEATGK